MAHVHRIAPGETLGTSADMHDVCAVVGGHERKIVAQAAHGTEDRGIVLQEHGDEAGNAALGQGLVDNVSLRQTRLRSSVGLVLDHDRQGSLCRWHDQIDHAAIGRSIGEGCHVAVDESGELVLAA